MRKIIKGSGGGGGKGGGRSARVPVEAPDSLQSKAFARVLDLISEGEIEGLVDGLASIYLDGTPIENADGTLNFSGVEYATRNGLQSQPYIQGFDVSENEIPVGVQVKDKLTPGDVSGSGAVVRTITNEEVTAARVRISVPQLTIQNTSNGDINGGEVEYAIDVQSDGQGFVEVLRESIIGKSTSKYERSYRIDLEGRPPWDIRVRRLTPDSTSSSVQNSTFWESFAELIDARVTYPNSALVGIEIDSSQFSNIPTRAYDIKGIKVKIPSNATVQDDGSLTYSGIWNGSFITRWTSNPAWILYDVLTNTRYGLGGFLAESQVDKWSFYEIGRYCDELVPDGFGGTEPRFSCNVYLQSREEAFKLIKDLASVFRAMTYWDGGVLKVVQDAPSDPLHLFTAANVVDGRFTYSGTSAKVRHTVAVVTWNDPDDYYRQKVEYVEDVAGIARFGVIETQIQAFACSSRGQANRLGRWLLYSEFNQTETVQFSVGMDGALCRPGDVIKVADPARAGSRRAGRVVSATTTSVTTDQVLAIEPATHTLSVMLPDGSIHERQIVSTAGATINFSTPLSTAPAPNSIWMVTSTDIEAQLFKIVGIAEGDNSTYTITALAHDPQKYDAVELGLTIQPRDISNLNAVPDAPLGLTITETLYAVNADVRVKVTISWNRVPFATGYIVQWQRDSGNIIELPETATNEVEILNAEPGIYYATVYAINAVGTRSQPAKAQRTIFGKAAAPANVTGFSLVPNAQTAYLSWNKATDLDVLIGGTVRIRYTPDTVSPVWKDAVDVVPALPGNATRVDAPLLSGTYMAKFVDSSGVASDEEAILETTVPEALALNVVQTVTESPTFPGARSNMEIISSGFGLGAPGLALRAASNIDDILENIDTIANFDFAGGVATSGTYDFQNVVDLGDVYTSKVTVTIGAQAIDVADTIDQRGELIDDWLDLDGEFIDDVNAELWVSTTEDDPSGSPVWTPYNRVFSADLKARAFRFQLRATSGGDFHNIVVQQLSVVIDMPDRVVSLRNIASGAGTYSVLYPEPFYQTPAVGITFTGVVNSGDFYEISNNSRTGFDIVFKNSGGTAVSRTFDVLAKGFGRAV